MTDSQLYERDFYAWANEQAALLRAGRLSDADNPSLKPQMDAAIAAAYRRGRREAAAEMGLDEARLPSSCPWSSDQIADEDFWPSASADGG